ncbi:MAG: NAD-dependent deacylase, partial [Deltaproteobacteria bacterium]
RENYEVPLKEIPPRCQCGALLRPHVVWFGESLNPEDLKRSLSLLERCEVLLVVGTSAVVQPVASFPWMAKEKGAFLIEVNPEPTPLSPLVDLSLRGKAGEVLPELLQELKGALD